MLVSMDPCLLVVDTHGKRQGPKSLGVHKRTVHPLPRLFRSMGEERRLWKSGQSSHISESEKINGTRPLSDGESSSSWQLRIRRESASILCACIYGQFLQEISVLLPHFCSGPIYYIVSAVLALLTWPRLQQSQLHAYTALFSQDGQHPIDR